MKVWSNGKHSCLYREILEGAVTEGRGWGRLNGKYLEILLRMGDFSFDLEAMLPSEH